MSLENILRREIEKNNELRERLLLVGFALELAKASTNDLEKTLQDWPEGQKPDVLTAALSHIKDIKKQLTQISQCAGENNKTPVQGGVVSYEIVPQALLDKQVPLK